MTTTHEPVPLLGPVGKRRLKIAGLVVAVLVGIWLVKAWTGGAPYHDSSASRVTFLTEMDADPVMSQASDSTLLGLSHSVCQFKASGHGRLYIIGQVVEDSPSLPEPSVAALVDASVASFCP